MAFVYTFMRTRRQVCNGVTLDDVTDNEIMKTTRFPRCAVIELSPLIGNDLIHPTARSHALPVEKFRKSGPWYHSKALVRFPIRLP